MGRTLTSGDVVCAEGAGYIEVDVKCDDDWTGWKDADCPRPQVAAQKDRQKDHDSKLDRPMRLEAPSPSPGTPQIVPDRHILCRSPEAASNIHTGSCTPQAISEAISPNPSMIFPPKSTEDHEITPHVGFCAPHHMTFATGPAGYAEGVTKTVGRSLDPKHSHEHAQSPSQTSQEQDDSLMDSDRVSAVSHDDQAVAGPETEADVDGLDKDLVVGAKGNAGIEAGEVHGSNFLELGCWTCCCSSPCYPVCLLSNTNRH